MGGLNEEQTWPFCTCDWGDGDGDCGANVVVAVAVFAASVAILFATRLPMAPTHPLAMLNCLSLVFVAIVLVAMDPFLPPVEEMERNWIGVLCLVW